MTTELGIAGRARVLRGGEKSPVPLRVQGIRGDYGRTSMSLTVAAAGDVQIQIEDPFKGAVTIDFAPTASNGRNPEIAGKLSALAKELADLIDSGNLR